VKELLVWLSQLENCQVVMVSTDGFVDRVVRESGLKEHVKYVTLNDMTEEQSEATFKKLLNLYSKKYEGDFKKLYNLVGGKLHFYNEIAKEPTDERIDEIRTGIKFWLRSAARGELGRSTDYVPPLVRYFVLQRLYEHSEENDRIIQQPPDEEAKKLEKYTSIGSGNGQGSCGIGLDIDEFIRAGVPREYIEKVIIIINRIDQLLTVK
jgi:hypothetical protein